MSQSRFVLKQIHVKGNGNSDLTRYVAKSKLNEEREGKKSRLLFSEHDDKLTAHEAKKFLCVTGNELRKDELLHYVLSFADEKDFEILGGDEKERRDKVVSILRDSITRAFTSIRIARIRWVAGVHRNTDNPHLHILLNKNAIEKATGELIQVKKLPPSLIAHHEIELDGSKVFSYGAIINGFAEQVDELKRERLRLLEPKILTPSSEILKPESLSKELTPEKAFDIGTPDREIPSASVNHSHKQHITNQSKEQTKDEIKEKTQDTHAHIHLF